MNVWKHFDLKFLYNFKDSNACVAFSDSFFLRGHVKNTIFKDKI